LADRDAPVLIYSTYPSLEAAEAAGGSLVDRGLAACINILPGMVSIYFWQGARHRDEEVVMLIKTRSALSEKVIAEARSTHPYTNPAFLVLPVDGGSADFCSWIMDQTARSP